jgi:hypothetical protein
MSEVDDLVERLRREKRRWKAAALASWAAVFLLAIAWSVVGVQARQQAERERAEAMRAQAEAQRARAEMDRAFRATGLAGVPPAETPNAAL